MNRLLQIAVLLALAGALFSFVRAPRDLALHKPVLMSSVRLGDPALAVNGVVEWGSYAVHSQSDSPAWLVVDLEGTFHIDEVVIHNRGDGYYDEGSARIAVDVSQDGRSFQRVGACTEIFTQASPCRVQLRGVLGRHVRIVHRSHLVVSEVEVFGSP